MASWLIHLRIADKLLDKLEIASPVHFVVGNIAPDSGELAEGTSATYVPPSNVSHWDIHGNRGAQGLEKAEMFRAKYLSMQSSPEAMSFYLGYYAHLVADVYWFRDLLIPLQDKVVNDYKAEIDAFRWNCRKDQKIIDSLYLSENPDFNAWSIFREVREFPNIYLDYFSETAIEKRIASVIEYYNNRTDVNSKEFKYINQDVVEEAIEYITNEILVKLKENIS